jgi:large-conductance mechanosensitive channel
MNSDRACPSKSYLSSFRPSSSADSVAAVPKKMKTQPWERQVSALPKAIRFTVNGSIFALGDFINALVSFLLVAVTVYFFVIVPVNAITTEGSKLIYRVFADRPRDLENAFSSLDDSQKEEALARSGSQTNSTVVGPLT